MIIIKYKINIVGYILVMIALATCVDEKNTLVMDYNVTPLQTQGPIKMCS